MPQRSFWKGYLKLSLVTCPVTMMPATTESERVRFRTMNAKSGHPVASRYVDAVTGKPVADDDLTKGYPRGEDEHVILEEEDLDSVALDSTRTIDIETFVEAETIGWIFYDKPHYLLPSDAVGEEAFAVIREAMAATGRVGISRLVMGGRERAVMLAPRGDGIVLWTLRYGDEVRKADAYFGKLGSAKPEAKLMTLVKSLIDERTAEWDPKLVEDPVQDNLLEMIAKKRKSKKTVAAPRKGAPSSGNVVNIMDALRQSLNKKS
ncbi:MAG: Ku domain protein precursor [Cereibacter sp.]|jgi:DNA end-binding protein Ku|nr:Ku domain protein precursor [Cereibacter sp.]